MFLAVAATSWWFSGSALLLAANRTAKVEVSGRPTEADVLVGRATMLVKLREPRKERSYQLKFEGDTDYAGDTGSVVNCDGWTAPNGLCFCYHNSASRPWVRKLRGPL